MVALGGISFLKLFHWGNPYAAHPIGRSAIERKRKTLNCLSAALALILAAFPLPLAAQTPSQGAGSALVGLGHLLVDNLPQPLGIDDPAPRFSWQLHDPARGAKQTAYQILVASSVDRLFAGKPDIWDSGRVASGQSIDILYAGPALAACTRYYWRVNLWNAAGQPFTASETSWWETGLMHQAAWRAKWIGYETPEEAAVRAAHSLWIANPDAKILAARHGTEQHYAFRATIALSRPVQSAALYATAQDTVSAWVNGAQVLTAAPLPPYRQTPWRKFVRADLTGKLKPGANSLAIDCVHYVLDPSSPATDAPPMIATLVVEYQDGTWATFGSNMSWRTSIHPAAGWTARSFNDSLWKHAFLPPQAPLGHPWIPDSVKELWRDFTLKKPVKSVRLYATALGAYTFFLNDEPVGDQVLAPGWTDYRDHVYYQTYDLAKIRAGYNILRVHLAPGWYETPLEWDQQPNNYGATPPALKAQLRIEYNDGSVEWISTDASWQASPSFITRAEIYDGESQNPQLVPWAGFPVLVYGRFKPAQVIQPSPVRILAQEFQPIRVETGRTAQTLTQPTPGVWIYDFSQNFSGVAHLAVSGPAGTEITLRFAEVLNPDGTLYTDNLRTAKATDHFVLFGLGEEELTPQFTFHGFRYAELTGFPGRPTLKTVQALVVHTDAPFTARLRTGSPLINQLWSNILWGQRSNFVGLPTDCPQRDERLGWMGDAQVFWRAASYNMDLAAFSRKFAADMRSTQAGNSAGIPAPPGTNIGAKLGAKPGTPYYGIYSPGTSRPNMGHGAGWSDAGVIIPWTSWLQTGDPTIINENWAAMTRYLEAIAAANPNGLWKNDAGIAFGDWLAPEGKTDSTLIATAYWAYDVTLMRQMALATGRAAAAQTYARLFEKVRAAFQKRFVRAGGFVAGADNTASAFGQIDNPDAKSSGGDTQTGYVLALHMNLLPDDQRAAAARHLAEKIHANHDLLGTGFLGTPYLLEELTRTGYGQLAYTLLLNTRYPSWGYMVTHGATTMWERWNGDQMLGDPGMNSFNHYAYGAVADWIYRYAAGIDATPGDPGFHTVVLHPVFDARLGSLAFDYDSSYGPIHSDWKITGSTATWRVSLPANTSGLLTVSAADAARYKLNGAPLTGNPLAQFVTRDGESGFELQPGSYTFEIQIQDGVQTNAS